MNNATLLSNSLTVLADQIKDAITASATAEKTAIEKALEAGHLLHEAKCACHYGEWLPFTVMAGALRFMKEMSRLQGLLDRGLFRRGRCCNRILYLVG